MTIYPYRHTYAKVLLPDKDCFILSSYVCKWKTYFKTYTTLCGVMANISTQTIVSKHRSKQSYSYTMTLGIFFQSAILKVCCFSQLCLANIFLFLNSPFKSTNCSKIFLCNIQSHSERQSGLCVASPSRIFDWLFYACVNDLLASNSASALSNFSYNNLYQNTLSLMEVNQRERIIPLRNSWLIA